MSQARFSSFSLLSTALVAVTLGFGLGYLLKPDSSRERSTGLSAARDGIIVRPGREVPDAGPVDLQGSAIETGARSQAAGNRERPGVSEANLRQAVAEVATPEIARKIGQGEIRGRVTDNGGDALQGVVLIASRRNPRVGRTRPLSDIAPAAPIERSLEETLEQAAENWAKHRAGRQRAISDGEGSFVLRELSDADYSIQAFKDGWVFDSDEANRARIGKTVNFKGRRVQEYALDVRLPDGSQPRTARIVVGGDLSSSELAWSPEKTTLRFENPRSVITAYSGSLELPVSNRDVGAPFKSEQLRLKPELFAEGALLVQLEQRSGIQGFIRDSSGVENYINVHLLHLPEGSEFEARQLAGSNHTTHAWEGEFAFLDLEPGTYAVGIPRGNQELKAHTLVEVPLGIVRAELEIPELDLDQHVIAGCFDPEGHALDKVRFTRRAQREGGSRSGGCAAKHMPDGSYWIDKSALCEFDYDDWPDGATIELTATHEAFGAQRVALVSGQREVRFQFQDPVLLTVQILGFAESEERAQLGVQVVHQDSSNNHSQVVAQTSNQHSGRRSPRISTDGRVTFDQVSPGSWRIQLIHGEGWYQPKVLDHVDVDLLPGEQEVQLLAPELHQLEVYAPSLEPGTNLWLNKEENSFDGQAGHAELDKEHRAVFNGLLAGTYHLRGGSSRTSAEVQVPRGELLYEPRVHDCVRVGITKQDGILAQAGFQSGDMIVAIDGKDVKGNRVFQQFYEAVGERTVSCTVIRDSRSVDVQIGPLEMDDVNMFTELGGTLLPDFQ